MEETIRAPPRLSKKTAFISSILGVLALAAVVFAQSLATLTDNISLSDSATLTSRPVLAATDHLAISDNVLQSTIRLFVQDTLGITDSIYSNSVLIIKNIYITITSVSTKYGTYLTGPASSYYYTQVIFPIGAIVAMLVAQFWLGLKEFGAIMIIELAMVMAMAEYKLLPDWVTLLIIIIAAGIMTQILGRIFQ